MSERILVIGDVIDDIIVIPGRAIRHDTDTPASISQRAGGSSANTAAWLGFAGADVDFYGCVGLADLARHSHELAQFGVRTFLNPDEIHPTGTIVILVMVWSMKAGVKPGLNLHLLGATVAEAGDLAAVVRRWVPEDARA